MDHLVSLEKYVRDVFAQKQQAIGLFFDLEKAYETTWQYSIIRVRIGTTLSDEFSQLVVYWLLHVLG